MPAAIDKLLASFAHLRAEADARLIVRASLRALPLPADDALAAPGPLCATIEQVILGARVRTALDLERLQVGFRTWEAVLYTTTYVQQFLLAYRKELLAYLRDAYLGLEPPDCQPVARAALAGVEQLLYETQEEEPE